MSDASAFQRALIAEVDGCMRAFAIQELKFRSGSYCAPEPTEEQICEFIQAWNAGWPEGDEPEPVF